MKTIGATTKGGEIYHQQGGRIMRHQHQQQVNHTISATVRALVLASALVSFAGCAVVKATNQPDKKNLSVFSTGTPRGYVIAEVGAPTFTEEKNGERTDIFTFKQGYSKGVKVGRAFFHGAADLMTLGMWEVVGTPFEAIADGTDMKIQVTYEQNRVKEVTYLAGR
jgi:hypothetical protein